MLAALKGSDAVVIIGLPRVDEAVMKEHRPDPGLLNNVMIIEINQQLSALWAEFPNCRPALSAMRMDMNGKTLDGIHLPKTTYLQWSRAVAEALPQ